jgi:hypothetical protein
MKKLLASSLALAALGLAAPMRAETVYVPVVEPVNAAGTPLATQLWISNFGNVERSYATALLQGDAAAKSIGATVPADRAMYLDKVAAEGETGLLAIDAAQDLLVNAWVKSTHGKQIFYAGLPVISSQNQAAAGATVYLNGVGREGSRDVSQVALANLGQTAAQCQVDVVDANGAFLRSAGSVEVPAKSLSRFDDALGLRGEAAATAKVSCDQPFYALASMVDAKTSEVSFVNPSAAIEKAAAPKPATGGTITFVQNGVFHTATKLNPKAILRIPVPAQITAGVLTADLDVIAGPWNPRQKSGAHNLLFLHRGRFRSNTIANINAYGPNANQIKTIQNIDMPPHYFTGPKFKQVLTQGHTYHITVLYDALSKAVSFTIAENGHVLRTERYDATAKGHELIVPVTGLVSEFGNYDWQALPEVGSIGWSFANYRVVIQPK